MSVTIFESNVTVIVLYLLKIFKDSSTLHTFVWVHLLHLAPSAYVSVDSVMFSCKHNILLNFHPLSIALSLTRLKLWDKVMGVPCKCGSP